MSIPFNLGHRFLMNTEYRSISDFRLLSLDKNDKMFCNPSTYSSYNPKPAQKSISTPNSSFTSFTAKKTITESIESNKRAIDQKIMNFTAFISSAENWNVSVPCRLSVRAELIETFSLPLESSSFASLDTPNVTSGGLCYFFVPVDSCAIEIRKQCLMQL